MEDSSGDLSSWGNPMKYMLNKDVADNQQRSDI